MDVTTILETKIDNLLKAIRRDLVEKRDAYSRFAGYTKALVDFNIITEETAKHYRKEFAKILF